MISKPILGNSKLNFYAEKSDALDDFKSDDLKHEPCLDDLSQNALLLSHGINSHSNVVGYHAS